MPSSFQVLLQRQSFMKYALHIMHIQIWNTESGIQNLEYRSWILIPNKTNQVKKRIWIKQVIQSTDTSVAVRLEIIWSFFVSITRLVSAEKERERESGSDGQIERNEWKPKIENELFVWTIFKMNPLQLEISFRSFNLVAWNRSLTNAHPNGLQSGELANREYYPLNGIRRMPSLPLKNRSRLSARLSK